MLLKTLRFVSLLCAALAFGLTLTHDLEIPGKQMLSAADWVKVQNTFYGGFALVGGVAEILGLISAGILLFWLARRPSAFVLTLIAALSFAGMLAVFAFGNNPINQQVMTWTPATIPTDWQQIRDAWDRFHAISSGLAALALTTLLIATLRETPSSLATPHGSALEKGHKPSSPG
ncbi:MAG TPA: anthrone oxygenase family protein [Ktedonobacterales bacterium]|nr:anthrone oxygenase family protein [Ktedonobacterales bacterium]